MVVVYLDERDDCEDRVDDDEDDAGGKAQDLMRRKKGRRGERRASCGGDDRFFTTSVQLSFILRTFTSAHSLATLHRAKKSTQVTSFHESNESERKSGLQQIRG